MKLISAREFNQDVSHAKREAGREPVFITDRGRPTHVLMSMAAFTRLAGETQSIVDLLAVSDAGEVSLDGARAGRAWNFGRDEA